MRKMKGLATALLFCGVGCRPTPIAVNSAPAPPAMAPASVPPVGAGVVDPRIDAALRNSALVYGGRPFHLAMEITPGNKAKSGMRGSVEVFWLNASAYKTVVHSPEFSQTRVVVGAQVEEHDEGDFYPRWLENFVQAVLVPIPMVEKLEEAPTTGDGRLLPQSQAEHSNCLTHVVRPGGITEETESTEVCLLANGPLIEGAQDFRRYVSFRHYEPFGEQQIAREWLNDIPENIFVTGRVTLLEQLSKQDALSIRVDHATPRAEQIRTQFVSRHETEGLIAEIPPYEWPAENFEALEGYMIVYVRTDRTGRVRESYWSSSDNYQLQDAGVRLALMSRFKPLLEDGVPVQMEGPLVLHFKTHRAAAPGGAGTTSNPR
jgi:hypothetical protein